MSLVSLSEGLDIVFIILLILTVSLFTFNFANFVILSSTQCGSEKLNALNKNGDCCKNGQCRRNHFRPLISRQNRCYCRRCGDSIVHGQIS
jgi:hypothetical protein